MAVVVPCLAVGVTALGVQTTGMAHGKAWHQEQYQEQATGLAGTRHTSPWPNDLVAPPQRHCSEYAPALPGSLHRKISLEFSAGTTPSIPPMQDLRHVPKAEM